MSDLWVIQRDTMPPYNTYDGGSGRRTAYSGMVLVMAAMAQVAFAMQYEGVMRIAAFGVAGFMTLCAVMLFIQSMRK